MTKSVETKSRAILVLGMHRSGTSAVTRVINLLGAKIGDRLVPPGHDNPSGFWENEAAVEINERLLRDLGRTWYDMREMPDGWMKTAAAAKALSLATKFIRHDLGGSTLCALKDPRICLTAPLWVEAFEAAKFDVSCLFVVRNPWEVVESLHRRNDWPRSSLYLMWVQYLLEAEIATRRYRRVMVCYDQMLDDWRTCTKRIADGLHLTWPMEPDNVAAAIDGYLDRSQRHHRAGDKADNDGVQMPALVRVLHEACLKTASDKSGWSTISGLRSDFRRTTELYAERVDAVLTERWSAEARAQTAESQLEERKSMEQVFQQTAQETRHVLEARLASLDGHVAGVEKQVALQSTKESQDALERRLVRLDERIASMEKLVHSESTERIAQGRDQASLTAGLRDAVRLSHEAFEARIGAIEQGLTSAVHETRQDIGGLEGRMLRHQETLQAVEARLQRQQALLNTVLLRLEQVADDRLSDRISALTRMADDLIGKVGALHGAEMQALQQGLENSNARLAGILRSTSWRLTRPLRWISVHLLRRPPANG